jgi:hypothetical protein
MLKLHFWQCSRWHARRDTLSKHSHGTLPSIILFIYSLLQALNVLIVCLCACRFSQQRFERAMVGTVEAPCSSSSASTSSWRHRLGRTATAGSGDKDESDDDSAGQTDNSSSSIDRQLLQQPYLQTVVQHLRQTGALGPSAAAAAASDATNSSSSSSGGRGRGAKRGAARSLLEAHTAVFQAALDLELQEEWSEAEQRLQVKIPS